MDDLRKDNTEDKILDAAHKVFMLKGMEGSRMQEIADEAGINKALLHYYFRSKERLFEAIVMRIFSQAYPEIIEILVSEIPIDKKIEIFIDKYLELLKKNPFFPAFIITEVNRDPDFITNVMIHNGINIKKIVRMLEMEIEKGTIRKTNANDLIVNILSMSIFPYAARPLLKAMVFENDVAQMDKFLDNRKKAIKEFVLNSIMIK